MKGTNEMKLWNVYVIADIGACHDGELDKMNKAIVAAKEAGCDAIKFQWTSDPRAMARRRGRAEADGYADIYARYLTWPKEWLAVLRNACLSHGIDFMCTVFLPQDVDVVAEHVRTFKVASFEASDRGMWDALAPHVLGGKEVVASLGMGQDKVAGHGGTGVKSRIKWLHCVSAYPAPVTALGLDRIRRDQLHGLSDHTHPDFTWTGALAVAAGATIVEAHLKLETTGRDNPDAKHAMTGAQFKNYVSRIRFADSCMTAPAGMQPCEEQMAQYRVTPLPADPNF